MKTIRSLTLPQAFVAGLMAVGLHNAAHAADGVRWDEGIGYYAGVDGLQTIASGTYAGLANPNHGRLTFLLDHGDHFHGLGAYSYTGPASDARVVPTNANNRVPELYARTSADNSALGLVAGTGVWSGQWVSTSAGSAVNADYGHLGLASIQSLTLEGTAGQVLHGSSSGRWGQALPDVVIGLRLESASPGLKVAIGDNMDVFADGAVHVLGDSRSFQALPIFHVGQGMASGIYSASFSLVNLGSNVSVRDSGVFHLDFAVPAVPEPQTWAMLLAGMAVLLGKVRQRGRRAGTAC